MWYGFNPHTHAGCDSSSSNITLLRVCFNPHTHAGCDIDNHIAELESEIVSIHTPTQGVTRQDNNHRPSFLSFNPHTHAGCDKDIIVSDFLKIVSIHTPTQGVTICNDGAYNYDYVSIHTPTQGVTKSSILLTTSFEFQSTHPRRV